MKLKKLNLTQLRSMTQHYFSSDTMQWWGCRLIEAVEVPGGAVALVSNRLRLSGGADGHAFGLVRIYDGETDSVLVHERESHEPWMRELMRSVARHIIEPDSPEPVKPEHVSDDAWQDIVSNRRRLFYRLWRMFTADDTNDYAEVLEALDDGFWLDATLRGMDLPPACSFDEAMSIVQTEVRDALEHEVQRNRKEVTHG